MRPLLVVATPTGVLSSSARTSCLFPIRDPVREYGLAGPLDVVGREVEVLKLFLLGVTEEASPVRGVPRVLADKALPGVGARLGVGFLKGDSGRGRDGLFGLNVGLVGLAPGPTDWENLRADFWGLKASSFPVLWPLIVLYEGVFGVPGNEPTLDPVGDRRFSARCTGRKIPAPGIEVWK